MKQGIPLCVDLDGTLIRGNSLWTLWAQRQEQRFLGTSWPMIKSRLAAQGALSLNRLQYNQKLVSLLQRLSKKGLPLFLVTGANERVAHQVSKTLGVFKEAIGSTDSLNLVGPQKAAYLIQRFGIFGYSYIGDSWRDVPVWEGSHTILAISGNFPLSVYLRFRKKKSQSLFFFPR